MYTCVCRACTTISPHDKENPCFSSSGYIFKAETILTQPIQRAKPSPKLKGNKPIYFHLKQTGDSHSTENCLSATKYLIAKAAVVNHYITSR